MLANDWSRFIPSRQTDWGGIEHSDEARTSTDHAGPPRYAKARHRLSTRSKAIVVSVAPGTNFSGYGRPPQNACRASAHGVVSKDSLDWRMLR